MTSGIRLQEVWAIEANLIADCDEGREEELKTQLEARLAEGLGDNKENRSRILPNWCGKRLRLIANSYVVPPPERNGGAIFTRNVVCPEGIERGFGIPNSVGNFWFSFLYFFILKIFTRKSWNQILVYTWDLLK